MNKTLKLLLIFTLVLFFALIFANTNVYATEPIPLTQDDFNLAKDRVGEDTGKIQYISSGVYACYFMTGTNYKLNGNIDIGAANIVFYSEAEGKDVSLDLSNYTIENGQSEDYDRVNNWDQREVIIFQNTNATITGTGTIKSNVDYSNAISIFEYENARTKNQKISNIKVQGGIGITDTKATINNVNITNGTLSSTNSDITINGGNYKNLTGAGAANFNGSNVTINSGTFTADIASAVYFFSEGKSVTLTIKNGTFTSTKDNGIELDGGTINIENGTFTGAMTGIKVDGYKALKLNGGTYKYTDTKEGIGPIAIYGADIEDVAEIIAEDKVLSEGEFKQIDADCITVNAECVTIQNKENEDTTGSGNTTGGNTTGGNTTGGNTTGGNTTGGNTTGGNTTGEDTTGEDTTGEDTTGEDTTEDTIIEISSTLSEISSIDANIKFTTPISKGNRLQITKQNDDKVSKELKTKEPNLKVVFDINIISDSGEIINIENNKMTIKIQLDKSLLEYENYEVVYIKDGKVEERIAATVKDGYIIFEASHLSEYGVIASNHDNETSSEQTTTNPKTGDNIILYSILSTIAIVGVISTVIIVKKEKTKKV